MQSVETIRRILTGLWNSCIVVAGLYTAIEVVVYRLRKKLAHTGTTLMTLRGLGYLLKDA